MVGESAGREGESEKEKMTGGGWGNDGVGGSFATEKWLSLDSPATLLRCGGCTDRTGQSKTADRFSETSESPAETAVKLYGRSGRV